MTNWFILAAGKADRCNGEIKQLYEIDGEPIIHRTVRLIREVDPHPSIYIVSWREELRIDGCTFINTLGPTRSVADAITCITPYVGIKNVIMYGDTVFTKDLIQTIYDNASLVMVYGKTRCDISNIPERYAVSFRGALEDDIIDGYAWCEYIKHPYRNDLTCALLPRWAKILSKLHNKGGIIGWIYWRSLVFLIAKSTPMILVTDPMVFDVDSPEELVEYKRINRVI